MAKKVYRFNLDCGRMGSLVGTFVTDERQVRAAIGKRCYFGEVLGKHSDIACVLEAEHFTALTDDASFIAKAKEYGLLPTGCNPLGVLADERAEKRLARKRQKASSSARGAS